MKLQHTNHKKLMVIHNLQKYFHLLVATIHMRNEWQYYISYSIRLTDNQTPKFQMKLQHTNHKKLMMIHNLQKYFHLLVATIHMRNLKKYISILKQMHNLTRRISPTLLCSYFHTKSRKCDPATVTPIQGHNPPSPPSAP